MPIVFSNEMPQDSRLREWWYNSLDCCVTLEVHHKLATKNAGQSVYAFERAMQGPALDMMLRGFRIDQGLRAKLIGDYTREEALAEERLNRLAFSVWRQPLNPRSPKQLAEFFYDVIRLPEVWISQRGEKKLSTNREALEKLGDYYIARPFISCILGARNARKTLGVLRVGVDADGRMRCTYNVCGTETGRWASSQNVFGGGTNLQNLNDKTKRMFVADPGYILVHVDGEQAESRSVGFIHGNLLDDWRYLDACEAGDLHTATCRMVWEDLPWTGDLRLDREIAEQVFYRDFTYRDMGKRGGHLSNYYGSPWMAARSLKVPIKLMESFRTRYISAFPFQRWWGHVGQQLTLHNSLTTFLGRERTFFGRPNDDATLREAIAYEPQSTVGDIVNEGGLRVWKAFPQAQVLAQTHDSYTFQLPETDRHLIPSIIDTFQVRVPGKVRDLVIPAEAMIGWNWAKADPKKKLFPDGNPDGLRKFSPNDGRTRSENPEASLLDRVIC